MAPRRSRLSSRRTLLTAVIAGLIAAGSLLGLYRGLAGRQPSIEHVLVALESMRTQPSTTILDRKGERLATWGKRDTPYITLDRIPSHARLAVLAAEDHTFLEHAGISLRGIARAFFVNMRSGRTVEGGSTITQQLVRLAALSPERTLTRKAHEAFLAIQLERRLSKEAILEAYLNAVYLGRGAWGIASAAHRYFRKSVEELDLAEGALLAALLRAPGLLRDTQNYQEAILRRRKVLESMTRLGWADARVSAQADSSPLTLSDPPRELRNEANVGYIISALQRQGALDKGGTSAPSIVQTTIDLRIQGSTARWLRQALRPAPQSASPALLEGFALVVDVLSFEIRALHDGPHYLFSEYPATERTERSWTSQDQASDFPLAGTWTARTLATHIASIIQGKRDHPPTNLILVSTQRGDATTHPEAGESQPDPDTGTDHRGELLALATPTAHAGFYLQSSAAPGNGQWIAFWNSRHVSVVWLQESRVTHSDSARAPDRGSLLIERQHMDELAQILADPKADALSPGRSRIARGPSAREISFPGSPSASQ